MKHSIDVPILESELILHIDIDSPKQCPLCKVSYYPNPIHTFGIRGVEKNHSYDIFTMYFCSACSNAFISKFHLGEYKNGYINTASHIWDAPCHFTPPELNEHLRKLSPGFCKMYMQSIRAEAEHLSELAGIGYRCALEFLVKDYLINMEFKDCSAEQGMVKIEPLSKSINRIANKNIRSLALGIAWLGNDYAHYNVKHPNRDIQDLKKFLNAVIEFIILELTVEDAKNFIHK